MTENFGGLHYLRTNTFCKTMPSIRALSVKTVTACRLTVFKVINVDE